MNWKILAFITMVLYGIGTFYIAKSNKIHGAEVACFLQMAGYALLLVLLGFGTHDFGRITRASFIYGSIAAATFVFGTFLMFRAIAQYPEHTAVISTITEGWPLITALLMYLSGQHITGRQWIGILLIMTGLAFVSIPVTNTQPVQKTAN